MLKLKRDSISATRCIAVTAMLSAASIILQYLEFPIPFLIPEFIKMDFSEFPALITAFSLGPVWGVLVCLIKNVINLPFSTTACVGELSNFVLGSLLVFPAGLIYYKNKTRTGALIGSVVGSLIMAVVSIPWNYYITYPAFAKILHIPLTAILGMYQAINPGVDGLLGALLIFNLPYTFCKGVVISLLTFLVYKKLSPILKGKR
jgi:riboflavin transporter FmnP